jgi:hypothetical protein
VLWTGRLLLARPCSHSESQNEQESIPFEDIHLGCFRGKEKLAVVRVGCGKGPPACRMAPILSETAGARDEMFYFFNGLIMWPA